MNFYTSVRPKPTKQIKIIGETIFGETFRPSAWAEMLMAPFYDEVKCENGGVRIQTENGFKTIIFNDLLGVHDHTKYEHLISFARAHKLKTKSDNFNHVF